MKRIILLTLIPVFLFVNCNKSSNDLTGDYYVANINEKIGRLAVAGLEGIVFLRNGVIKEDLLF
jgi:hypothetical protein